MTPENILQKLVESPPAAERHDLLIGGGPWTVTVSADRRDDLSSRVWHIAFERKEPQRGGVADWAERIATRVSGLSESLKLVEVDDIADQALLRSDKPAAKSDNLAYYEVHLRGTRHASFRRVQASPAKSREQVSFAVTNETLAKLIADITGE